MYRRHISSSATEAETWATVVGSLKVRKLKISDHGSSQASASNSSLLESVTWLIHAGSWLGILPFDVINESHPSNTTHSFKPVKKVEQNTLRKLILAIVIVPIFYVVFTCLMNVYQLNVLISQFNEQCKACRVVYLGMILVLPIVLAAASMATFLSNSAHFQKLLTSMAGFKLEENQAKDIKVKVHRVVQDIQYVQHDSQLT
jgi:hypothetical protein